AYPFTGAGCAFQLCSPYTELPIQARELPAAANTSFSWTGSAPGNWNVSYDIWFDHHNQITAQDDGAELMIWLRPNPGYRGGGRGCMSRTVGIGSCPGGPEIASGRGGYPRHEPAWGLMPGPAGTTCSSGS